MYRRFVRAVAADTGTCLRRNSSNRAVVRVERAVFLRAVLNVQTVFSHKFFRVRVLLHMRLECGTSFVFRIYSSRHAVPAGRRCFLPPVQSGIFCYLHNYVRRYIYCAVHSVLEDRQAAQHQYRKATFDHSVAYNAHMLQFVFDKFAYVRQGNGSGDPFPSVCDRVLYNNAVRYVRDFRVGAL